MWVLLPVSSLSRSLEINSSPLDVFTLAHFVGGTVCGAFGIAPVVATVMGAGWEVIERPLKRRYPAAFPHPTQDTLNNSLVDFVSFMAGYYLSK